jgi:hypothetical protein
LSALGGTELAGFVDVTGESVFAFCATPPPVLFAYYYSDYNIQVSGGVL